MSEPTRVERMQEVLGAIQRTSVDIVGSAIVTLEGFVVASRLPPEVDEELVTSLASNLLGAAGQVSRELMGAGLEQVLVKTGAGYLIATPLNADEALLIVTTREVRLGLVFNEARKRVEELVKLL